MRESVDDLGLSTWDQFGLRPATELLTLFAVPETSAKNSGSPKALKISAAADSKMIETSLQRRDAVVIGRGPDCDVVIQDIKASRRHCKLTRREDGFLLEDLGSKNGTFVDGERISGPVALKSNHTFKIGDTVFYLA